MFVFLSQVITGVFLALYYVPSADHAHTTVAYIAKEVAAGSFLRSLHVYGSSAMVIIVVLHISQTFLYGSYKGRRELLWLSGTVLLRAGHGAWFSPVTCCLGIEKAYFATAVGTNVPSEIPVVGTRSRQVMRGGSELGTLTISRFFVAHVFMIPGLIFLLIGTHIVSVSQSGSGGSHERGPVHPKLPTESFYPRQLLMDLGVALVVIVVLGLLALFEPAGLGPEANPSDTQFLPRPEWYYRSFFQWLKFWNGNGVVVGIGVIPLIVAVLFVGLPFIDRRSERRPWKRPLAVGLALVFGGLIIMERCSYYADAHDPVVASQLACRSSKTKEFMQRALQTGATRRAVPRDRPQRPPQRPRLGAGAAVSDPAVAAGQNIFQSHACFACHGRAEVGTPMAPKLAGIGQQVHARAVARSVQPPHACNGQGAHAAFPVHPG